MINDRVAAYVSTKAGRGLCALDDVEMSRPVMRHLVAPRKRSGSLKGLK
jgi:hypothetical protein